MKAKEHSRVGVRLHKITWLKVRIPICSTDLCAVLPALDLLFHDLLLRLQHAGLLAQLRVGLLDGHDVRLHLKQLDTWKGGGEQDVRSWDHILESKSKPGCRSGADFACVLSSSVNSGTLDWVGVVAYLSLGLLQLLLHFDLLFSQQLICLHQDTHGFGLLHQLIVLGQSLGCNLAQRGEAEQ